MMDKAVDTDVCIYLTYQYEILLIFQQPDISTTRYWIRF